MLSVYKASAGSGKTFQLVVEYLKLLIEDPSNYKHILAVTFTNKATNEMKSRILEQLYVLANQQESDYIIHLQKGNLLSEKEIRSLAKKVLKNILHDYNRFAVNTIDSFTQRTIKAFNRELGITPNYSVELDNEMILAEATDSLLSKIGSDKKLKNWLKEFSREKIENQKSQRLYADIKKLGEELFKEKFQVFFPEDGESVYSRENLEEFGKTLRAVISDFERELKNLGQSAYETIKNQGFTFDDFSYKKAGVAGYILKIAEGEIKEPGTRVNTALEDVEKWFSKKHPETAKLRRLVETFLQTKLLEIKNYIENNLTQYNTCLAVSKQLRMLGILTNLKEEIKLLLIEKGALQLSDSNLLLNKIIGQSDAPFIYEKTGNYYNHFMLDEFQDTSGLQWENFKPLVKNALAEGNSNLIVGDVKQSIYRWRNSDWNILANKINNDFSKAQLKEQSLESNWRSDKNIIDFNNHIFKALINTFKTYQFEKFETDADEAKQKFESVYDSFLQKPGRQDENSHGFVNVNFLAEEDFLEESNQLLINQVKEIQDKGIAASEIAILTRTNSEGSAIVKAFLNAAAKIENTNYNLSVLSNESLFLNASQSVLFIMDVIEYLIDPNNVITKYALNQKWNSWLNPGCSAHSDFPESLAEKLNTAKEKVLLTSLDESITQICSVFNLFEIQTELPFIQTLIDKAGELKTTLSNDLSNFLFWWYEKGFKTSVSVNENVDSVRLLTVHKSKGLEFKAVLVPYFNWKTSWIYSPILWCTPKTSPFNKFPLLPIEAGGLMEKSLFRDEYLEELQNYLIDSFNLIYVAFTRAKSVLIINCPEAKEPKKRTPSPKSTQYLMYKSLENISSNPMFSTSWNDEKTAFRFGSIPVETKQTIKPQSLFISKYHFNDFGEKIKLRLSGEDFLIEGDKKESIRNQGKIIHDILSEIETIEDVQIVGRKALSEGMINKDELENIKFKIYESLKDEPIKSWFNGTYSILNERSLLTPEKLLRPDRIMYAGQEAVVVDYKTGDKKSDAYQWQINRYAKVLKDTGFKKVSGYLWYINQNELEKVCEL